ncbi:MAG TPA: ABC transporter permease, partial [Bacillota bacterium]
MYTYMIRRLAHGLITILIVVTFVFFLIRLTGDPAALMAGDSATQGDIEAMRRQLGLDRPLYVQYLDYVRGLLRGDLGDSARHRTPALPLVLERMPATVELTGIALVLSLVVAVPVASISATRRNSWADAAARVVAVAGQCVPI